MRRPSVVAEVAIAFTAMPGEDLYKTRRRALAKYANDRGDVPQQRFRYALDRFIANGLPVTEAETKALASVRNTHPGFRPTIIAPTD